MMDVKMHFATCFKFFAMVNIWWPQNVIWMFDLDVFCCFPEIFCCGEQPCGHEVIFVIESLIVCMV